MSVEISKNIDTPRKSIDLSQKDPEKALEDKIKLTGEKIKDWEKFLHVEWIPQMEICAENNNLAMDMFCRDQKNGLFSFESSKYLLPKLEKQG